MILGLRTVIYPAPELAKSKIWYERVFGQAPYFDEPFYVGFSVGGFELGLVPDEKPSPAGAVAYWGVADLAQEMKRLGALGIAAHEAIKEVGGGIKVATVLDPHGNQVGLIENPQFKLQDLR